MSLMMMVALRGGQTKSVTITATQNWIAPAGVIKVDLSGRGAAGTPASSGVRDASAQFHTVTGHASGSGSNNGSFAWPDFQSDIQNARNTVNAGGNGVINGVIYNGYPNNNTYSISLYQGSFSNASPGTAYIYTSQGWKTSGDIGPSDYGFVLIGYTQFYDVPATIGAGSTGFGRNFAGGAGGAASVTNYVGVAVSPGTSYPLTVPAGGFITISWTE